MSKLLDLLEYTRSRMAEKDAADEFASAWKMENHRRSEEIVQSIAEALPSESASRTIREQRRPI